MISTSLNMVQPAEIPVMPSSAPEHADARDIYENRWNVRPVWLRYTLGELKLFTAKFEMAVLDVHFMELAEHGFIDWQGWANFPSCPDGILVRSHPVNARLSQTEFSSDAIRYVPAQYERFYMEFQGSFDEYLGKFSSKVRANRKREVKKFAELSGGEIDWREYRKPDDMAEFLSHANNLSRKTFQAQLLDAGLPTDDDFRKKLTSLAALGKVRAYLLFLNNNAISYLLMEVGESGVLIYRYLGYDPESRNLSPGTVLHMKAFEKLFAEGGLSMLDFTEGEGAHKKFFATASKQCADIYFFKRSLRNRFLITLHSVMGRFSEMVGATLDRIGIKAKVKKFMRAQAAKRAQ